MYKKITLGSIFLAGGEKSTWRLPDLLKNGILNPHSSTICSGVSILARFCEDEIIDLSIKRGGHIAALLFYTCLAKKQKCVPTGTHFQLSKNYSFFDSLLRIWVVYHTVFMEWEPL